MVTTPLTQHSVATLRARPSMMPSPVVARISHADATPEADVYATVPAAATAPATTVVVNPWLGDGMCGVDTGVNCSNGTSTSGFATKRIHPGRLEAMT